MIYEAAVLATSESSEEMLTKVGQIFTEVVAQSTGEILLKEDWGTRVLAQATSKGVEKGRYLYFMYKANDGSLNSEIERRLRINESVIKSLIVKLGKDAEQEKILKNYKNPFASR